MSTVTEASPARPASIQRVHLLVLCHGLWGTPEHLSQLERLLMERWEKEHSEDGIKLVLLGAVGNKETNTYDGIDLCSERITREIDALTAEQEAKGAKVVRFSIVGYSLGGLIARFTLGLLHSRQPSYFDSVEPVNFSTFATPHLGIPRYKTFWSPTLIYLGSKFLSRSGGQLYAKDDFYKGKPLIEVMSQERSSFGTALRMFPHISIYASAINDLTVPYPSGSIERADPFAKAYRRMARARKNLVLPPDQAVDLKEGGLKLTMNDKYNGLIESFEQIKPVPLSQDKPLPKRPWYSRFSWPILLKPSGYPFFPPVVRYIVVFSFPIIVPFFLVLVIGRFILQNYSSQRRIRRETVGELKTSAGRLKRVGLMLDGIDDMLETNLGLANAASLNSSDSRSGTATPDDREGAPLQRSKSSLQDIVISDPQLTDDQLAAVINLNAIPQLRKYLAWFPTARNAHGTLICRTESFPGHRDGLPIVQHWADHFEF